MSTRRSVWSRLAAAFIVAIGIQIVWGLLLIWGSTIVDGFSRRQDQYYETLGITTNGTAVIGTRSYQNPLDWSYRTLDGKPFPDLKDDEFLTGESLPAAVESLGLIDAPIGWSLRIASVSDDQRSASTGWYVVRDGRRSGAAYLVGYDSKSKLPVGYFGRNGFRRSMPPAAEWFNVGRRVLTYGSGEVASTGGVQYGALATYYGTANRLRPPPWHLFLLDGDKLLEIDLRKRTLRTVLESDGLVSIGCLVEYSPRTAEVTADADNEGAAEPDVNGGEPAMMANRLTQRIVLRTTDKVILLDPPTGEKREYLLPDSLHNEQFQVFSNSGPQLILQLQDISNPLTPRVLWLNPDGSVERDETAMLAAGWQGEGVAIVAAVAPIPAAWIGVPFAVAPYMMLHDGTASTYSEAVATIIADAWPALIVVTLIGVILTVLTYRLQRKYHRPATALWCTFVLLLGWPAFLAYWIEHRRPKLEECRDCGQTVPRDRDACAACNKPFPAPQLVGTEIFA